MFNMRMLQSLKTYLWLVGNGKNGSNSSYNCTPFLHSLLTKGKKAVGPGRAQVHLQWGTCGV